MRTVAKYNIEYNYEFKTKLLQWANQYREVVVLDSNLYNQKYSNFNMVVAVGAFTSILTDWQNAFEDLHNYQSVTKDWLFGYLSNDLKNDIEKLQSNNFDGLQFPDLYFFQPKKIFLIKENTLEIQYLNFISDEIENDFETICNIDLGNSKIPNKPIQIQQRITKDEYVNKVNTMLQHIHRGNIYEANFCMEFFAENCSIQPTQTFNKLNYLSQAPFSVYFKNNNQYLLCASLERYLQKEKDKLISQPIKGTAKRSNEINEDEFYKNQLEKNPKERSENIMIVDLVRNDLSKTAQKNSVQVEELCKVYSFKQVHQMISTVVSTIKDDVAPVECIKTTFPMGSMTGAPKISAMQIIEELEETKRGLYSGALGYFTPNGDFDFNVVIRSILFNAQNNYLSFSVGSAITSKSNPENEYEECLLKAKAMFEVLQSK